MPSDDFLFDLLEPWDLGLFAIVIMLHMGYNYSTWYIYLYVSCHDIGHAIKSVTCFELQFSCSTRPMTSFCIFIAYI